MATQILERVSIPPSNDRLEGEIRQALDRIGGKADSTNLDCIIRWYRNELKAGTPDQKLRDLFLGSALTNLTDEVIEYRDTISRNPSVGKMAVEIGDRKVPASALDRIRRLGIAVDFMSKVRKLASSGKHIPTPAQFKLNDKDLQYIKLAGSTENVVAFETQLFDVTNKFIFHLWKNPNMNVDYGDPRTNSPFCTRMKIHWDSYANAEDNFEADEGIYRQVWFFRKPPVEGLNYAEGPISEPGPRAVLDAMEGLGKDLLISMDDSCLDFLGRDDEDYIPLANAAFGYEVVDLDSEILKDPIEKAIDDGDYDDDMAEARTPREDMKIILPAVNVLTSGVVRKELQPVIDDDEVVISDIVVPEGVVEIADNAFDPLGDIMNDRFCMPESWTFTLPSTLRKLGKAPLMELPQNISTIRVPKSLQSMGKDALNILASDSCSLDIEYGGTLADWCMIERTGSQHAANLAFNSLVIEGKNLLEANELEIPAGTKWISDGAFDNLSFHSFTKLSLKVPGTVKKIGKRAFASVLFKSAVIEDGVEEIDDEAFDNCTYMLEVTIPASVKRIGARAFRKCIALERVTIHGNPKVSEDSFDRPYNETVFVNVDSPDTDAAVLLDKKCGVRAVFDYADGTPSIHGKGKPSKMEKDAF